MIYRIIGAVIVTLSCGGFGLTMAVLHRKEVQALQSLISAINFMRCELECRAVALPELCVDTSKISNSKVGRFFYELGNELQTQVCPDLKCCVTNALHKISGLPKSAENVIISLSETLGCFHLAGQLNGLESAVRQAEQYLDKLTFEQDTRLRRYQTLGLCAGAALAILMI